MKNPFSILKLMVVCLTLTLSVARASLVTLDMSDLISGSGSLGSMGGGTTSFSQNYDLDGVVGDDVRIDMSFTSAGPSSVSYGLSETSELLQLDTLTSVDSALTFSLTFLNGPAYDLGFDLYFLAGDPFVPIGLTDIDFGYAFDPINDGKIYQTGGAFGWEVVTDSGGSLTFPISTHTTHAGPINSFYFTYYVIGSTATSIGIGDMTYNTVPEPLSLWLLGIGGCLVFVCGRFRSLRADD